MATIFFFNFQVIVNELFLELLLQITCDLVNSLHCNSLYNVASIKKNDGKDAFIFAVWSKLISSLARDNKQYYLGENVFNVMIKM